MILLDAAALVALAKDEPAADEVSAILEAGDAAISSVNLAELIDQLVRVDGRDPQRVDALVQPLVDEKLRVRSPSGADAWRAALIRARYYDRKTCALSLADCFLLAATGDESIATSDQPVAGVARAEGVTLIALPNSAGERPQS
ncbi:MAG: PIN domain-containing protein [Actinobacteria bacterium]|nr:PIN domain-containing protein [Actinomycetota bacterium]